MRRWFLLLALIAGLGLLAPGSYSAEKDKKAPDKKPADKADKKAVDKKAADKKPVDKDAVARKEIARLIGKLASETPEDREAAAKALEKIGVPALEPLRNALAGDNAEVQKIARELVKKLEKRVDSERILAPTLVKLSFKNKLVVDAVAELAKKSGYRIAITGDTSELRKRRITMDMGEVPFWQAFDQICLKASLIESEGRTGPGIKPMIPGGALPNPMPVKPINPGVKLPNPGVRPMFPGGAPMVPGGVPMAPGAFPNPGAMMPGRPGQEQAPQIYLEDGNPVELPTIYAGALRIRALPADSLVVTQQKGANETVVLFEVTAEPRLQWQGLESVLVEKAVDENDQALAQVKDEKPMQPGGVPGIQPAPGLPPAPGAIPGAAPALPDAAPPAVKPAPPALIPMPPGIGVGPGRFPMNAQAVSNQVPIRFTIAEKPSKVMKELRGLLVARVLTPSQTLITVPNILEAEEKTIKGDAGGSIEILEVQAQKKGEIKIRLQLIQPPDVQDAAAAAAGPGIGGPGIGPMPMPLIKPPMGAPGFPGVPGAPGAATTGKDTFGISLLDTRGKKFLAVGASTKAAVHKGVVSREYTLTFQPQGVQGKPAKLIYEAARSATVEVPFAVADVPLP